MTCKRISFVLALMAILCLTLSFPAAAQDKEQGDKAKGQEKAEQAQMSKQAQMQKDVQRMQELGQKLTKIREEAINSNPDLKKELDDFKKSQQELQEKGKQLQKDIEEAMKKQDPKTKDLLKEYTTIRKRMQPFMRQ